MTKVIKGRPGQVYAFRIKPGEPFLETIQQVCEENNILNGVILSAMGSLDGARFFAPVEIPEKEFPYGYGDPTIMEGPVELIGATGFISHGDENEVLLHVHVSLGDDKGNGFAGHLIEGNKALFTIDVVLMELEGLAFKRRWDDYLGVFMFSPEDAEEQEEV